MLYAHLASLDQCLSDNAVRFTFLDYFRLISLIIYFVKQAASTAPFSEQAEVSMATNFMTMESGSRRRERSVTRLFNRHVTDVTAVG